MPGNDLEREVLDRLDVSGQAIDVIERWLAAELQRHATRLTHAGWRDVGVKRRVTSNGMERVFSLTARDLAPVVEELRALGFNAPDDVIDGAIYAVGRGVDPDAAAQAAIRRVMVATKGAA
jgi:hypothetical protein